MNCEQYSENMSAYLDGELDPRAQARLRDHFAACASCAADLDGLRNAARFVESNAPDLELPPGLWNRVQERIAVPAESTAGPWWRALVSGRRWVVAGAAAALMIAAAGGGLLFQKQKLESEASALMKSYTRMRVVEEQWHFAQEEDPTILPPESPAASAIPAGNPFAVVKYDPEENPFRSEE
jgi:anti-sigma factor RsiW